MKVTQTAFAEACSESCQIFIEYWGDLWMVPSLLDKHSTGYKSSHCPHNWLVRLIMDIALQLMPFDCFYFTCSLNPPFHGSPPLPPPYRSACGIGVASKTLSKMADNSASYSFNSLCIDRLCTATEPWQMHASICFPSELRMGWLVPVTLHISLIGNGVR